MFCVITVVRGYFYDMWDIFQIYNLQLCAFHLQDNEGDVARNSGILKELETRLNDAMTGAKNAIKSEGNLVKKCILRRGASFYTAVKRIKSGKKPRQTFARRALKNHCANNVENSAIICAIKSKVEAKPFLKAIDRCRSNRCNVGLAIGNTHEPRLSANRKLTATKVSSAKMRVSSEETAAVRHGAKRLKIISSTRITSKPLPEVGESSCSAEEVGTKASSKIPCICDKQNVKGSHERVKSAGRVKASESSKLKKINKTAVKESSMLEENAKQNPK